MKHNFDSHKSSLELKIDKTANILERTHPEQTTDAMADYAKALAILGNETHFGAQPVIIALKRLYVYPNRKEHNKMLIELHNFREFLYETRIDDQLEKRQQKKNLGEDKPKPSNWPWLLIIAISLIVLLKV